MTIDVHIDPLTSATTVSFTIPDDNIEVSVVGSFNDWVPGAHTLLNRGDGTRSVTVTINSDDDIHFRYLGSGGVWFDDPDADELTPDGSIIHPLSHQHTRPSSEESTATAAGETDAADTASTGATPSAKPGSPKLL